MSRRRADGAEETLAIPQRMRDEVDERDQGFCRVCGQYAGERRALHHARFGGDLTGVGGRRMHHPDNLITVGWLFEHDCHSILHGRKNFWLPYVLKAIATPGVTVLQLVRWEERERMRTPTRYAPRTLEEIEEAFWTRVDRSGECWMFEGSDPERHNYGQFRASLLEHERGRPQTPIPAHHVAWRLTHGAWASEHVLHTCDRPGCVRPEHLYEGDQAQNMADRRERKPRNGEANPAARLTWDIVREMREAHAEGVPNHVLVSEYGVSSATVSRIVNFLTWQEESRA